MSAAQVANVVLMLVVLEYATVAACYVVEHKYGLALAFAAYAVSAIGFML